jgi:hypothetical protein
MGGSLWQGWGCLTARELLLRGGAAIHKMATLLLYLSPFFFNNGEGRDWGSGIGVKHQSL